MSAHSLPLVLRRKLLAVSIALSFSALSSAAELVQYTHGIHAKRADGVAVARFMGAIDFDRLKATPRYTTLALTLPNGERVSVMADRMITGLSGAQTWVGQLTPNTANYRVYVTRSASGEISGTIETAQGQVTVFPQGSAGQVSLIDYTESGVWTPMEADDHDGQYPRNTELDQHDHGHQHAKRVDVLQPAWIQDVIKQAAQDQAQTQQNGAVSKAAPAGQATIDLLVVTTPGWVTKHGSNAAARIDQMVAQANRAMADSDVAMTIRLVGVRETTYSDTASNSVALNELSGIGTRPAALDSVPTWRNQLGADLVVMLRPFNRTAHVSCGQAWITGSGANSPSTDAAYGFSVVSEGSDTGGTGYFCDDTTFTHEMGHNMGLLHDRTTVQNARVAAGCSIAADALDACHTYGSSYYAFGANVAGATGTKGTIMSYTRPRLNRFSNPLQFDCDSAQCGVPHPQADACNVSTDPTKCRDPQHRSADEARALNRYRAVIANFRTTASPAPAPTAAPTPAPTAAPTPAPTAAPTPAPTAAPTPAPTAAPTPAPTAAPTPAPTPSPMAVGPAGLSTTTNRQDGVMLGWTADASLQTKVYRCVASNSSVKRCVSGDELIATAAQGVGTYLDTTARTNVRYAYRVTWTSLSGTAESPSSPYVVGMRK